MCWAGETVCERVDDDAVVSGLRPHKPLQLGCIQCLYFHLDGLTMRWIWRSEAMTSSVFLCDVLLLVTVHLLRPALF